MRRIHFSIHTEGIKAFSNGYGVVVWTVENDTKTISVDANVFENEAKQLRFRLKTDSCGRGLNLVENASATRQLAVLVTSIAFYDILARACAEIKIFGGESDLRPEFFFFRSYFFPFFLSSRCSD